MEQMRLPEQVIDVETAEARLLVVDRSLRLARQPLLFTGLSWARMSVAVAWICVARFLLELYPARWARWSLLVSVASCLVFLVWNEVDQFRRMSRAPTKLLRVYRSVWVLGMALATAGVLAVQMRLIDQARASIGVFVVVGAGLLCYSIFLRPGLRWIGVFCLPWWAAAILAPAVSQRDLLLVAAMVSLIGGALPGFMLHRRA